MLHVLVQFGEWNTAITDDYTSPSCVCIYADEDMLDLADL